jgi:hypothetical protein
MEDLSSDALALLQSEAPYFIEVVRRRAEQSRTEHGSECLQLTLDMFYDDPMLLYTALYTALWHAATEGVAVTFLPKLRTGKTSQAETLRSGPDTKHVPE